jgi:hypothetical protein
MEAFKISVEVNVNLNLAESTQQFIQNVLLSKALVNGLAGSNIAGLCGCKPVPTGEESPKAETPVQEALKAEAPKTKGTKSKGAKAEAPKAEVPAEEAPKAEVPAEEAPKAEVPAEEAPKAEVPAVTVDDVRRELAKKVGTYRETIKQKLNSLDAPSVTKLSPEKYQEMFDFLKALPGNED